jgi:ACS family D-galactonate transporter-like MFS transporter
MSHPDGSLDVVPVDSPPHATWVRWRVVSLLLAFSFMSWFNRVSMSAAYDERIKDELGISEGAIGAVYSVFLFAYMLCMTPGGLLADHIGPRWALALMGFGSALFCALTGAAGMLALSAAGVFTLLVLIRATMGAFTAPIYPASGRALMHWLPPQQRAGANGAVMGAALLGIACTYFGFGALLDWFDWPAAFLITGGVTALLAAIWTCYATDWPAQHRAVNDAELRWIEPRGARRVAVSDLSEAVRAGEPPRWTAAREEAPSAWPALFRNRSLMLLTVSYAAVGYFEYLFYFWMHYYFDGVLKLGKTESRVFATILYVAMAAGMFLGGWVSDRLQQAWGRRLGRAAVAVGGMLGGAAFLGVGLVATEPGWIVTWFALALAAVGATEGPLWATALELGGRHGATAAGIFNTGGNAGGVVAPIVTPLVSQSFGWGWGIGLGSLVCLAGVTLWLWIDPGEGERRQVN